MSTLTARPHLSPSAVPGPALLLVGFDKPASEELRRLLGSSWTVLAAASEDEALALLAQREVAVLCLGTGVGGERARRFVERLAVDCEAGAGPATLVLAGGPDPHLFADQIDRDQIFYLTQEPIPPAELAPVVESAAGHGRRSSPGGEPLAHLERLLEAARRMALQRDPESAAELAAEALAEVVAADRTYHLLFDPAEEVLHAGTPGSPGERRESAAVGLVSFVARTGRPVRLAAVGGDPRFEREADDPGGDASGPGGERFLAVPAVASDGRTRAVLVAVREAEGGPFSDADREVAERLADQLGPVLERLALEARLERSGAWDDSASGEIPGAQPGLFRGEAAAEYLVGRGDRGEVLRLTPHWMHWAYWLLLAVVVAGFLFAAFGRITEYASGPAVVRLGGHHGVTAATAGTVTAVEVAAGDEVVPGQPLLRFYRAQETAELTRLEREIELTLLQRLRSPADPGPAQALTALRAQRELARARLDERSVEAPVAGVVSDLRIFPGRHVAPGETLLTLSEKRSEPAVVTLLPGNYRPLLAPGMPLRLELGGFRHAYQRLEIGEVGDEIIGPAEARRFLGPEIADAVALDGAVVVVTARIPEPFFESRGRRYSYHDGMSARVEVPVRSEPILVALFPRLADLFGGEDD